MYLDPSTTPTASLFVPFSSSFQAFLTAVPPRNPAEVSWECRKRVRRTIDSTKVEAIGYISTGVGNRRASPATLPPRRRPPDNPRSSHAPQTISLHQTLFPRPPEDAENRHLCPSGPTRLPSLQEDYLLLTDLARQLTVPRTSDRFVIPHCQPFKQPDQPRCIIKRFMLHDPDSVADSIGKPLGQHSSARGKTELTSLGYG